MYMRKFQDVVLAYIQAIATWEQAFQDRYTGPNSFGVVRDPQALRSAEEDFFRARFDLNRLLRRATDISHSVGVLTPYNELLNIVLDDSQNPFHYTRLLSGDLRMAVFDSLTQTIAALETGY